MQGMFDTDSIRYSKNISYGYDVDSMHIHDVYEIYMVQSSGIKFLVNGQIFELDCGDVMLFTNRDLHKVSVPQDSRYERHIITFPPHILPERERAELLMCFERGEGQHNHKVKLTPEEQKTFLNLIKALDEEGQQQKFNKLGQQLELCRILLFLNRVRSERQQMNVATTYSTDSRIRRVLEYVDTNYEQQITLDELGGLCYLNKYYLCRLFRQETGFCIHDYITYRRLSVAVGLLRKGESVSAAARLSGFKSDSFFITTFKKHFGKTPYQYMHQCL